MMRRTQAWMTMLAAASTLAIAPSSEAANPHAIVRRVEASGVWSWVTRVQHVRIRHWAGGEVWRQRLLSAERWEHHGGAYRDFTMVESPPIMRGIRLLNVAGPRVRSGRWIYIPEFRKPRRLPPFRRGAYLDHIFRPLALLQELPLRLRRSRLLRHETTGGGAEVLFVAATRDAPDALELTFAGEPLLLRRVIVHDRAGRPTHLMRVGEYRDVQSIPTPHRLRIADPERSLRTAVDFSRVEYDAAVPDDVFSVPTFGESSIRLGWATP